MEKIQQTLQLDDDAEDNPLKCSICKHFLSVPPIVLNSTLGSICGREVCRNLASSEGINYRQSAYEELAKVLEFPCMYKENGCKKVLSWYEIGKHEINCKYVKLSCPFSTDRFEDADQTCEWKGNTSEMLAHMEEDHSPHKFSNHLQVSLEQDIKKNKLWFSRIQDSIIIVLAVIDDKTYTHWKVWTVPKIWKNFNYKIEISSEQGQGLLVSKSQRAELLNSTFFKSKMDNSWFKINFDCFKNFTDSPHFLTTKFYLNGFLISPLPNRSCYDRTGRILLLSNRRCDQCKEELFGTTVYSCESDHTICNMCFEKKCRCYLEYNGLQGSFCPVCQPWKDQILHRNSAFDKLVALCNKLYKHCIVCNKKVNCLSSHMYDIHPEYISTLGEFHNFRLNYNYFSFDDHIFLFSINFNANKDFTFSVQCLGTLRVKYIYELKLSSASSYSAMAFANICSPDITDLKNNAEVDVSTHETLIPENLFVSVFPDIDDVEFKLNITTL